jgi:8-oxo-dGTP pyrophosphatase MutT (NUDIX family)
MNKKIYFNDKFIEFIQSESQVSHNQSIKKTLTLKDENKELKKIIDTFLSDSKSYSIIVSDKNIERVLSTLKTMFYYIEAAGGFIEKDKKYLCIHRHGRWDLPKGKLELNETIEAAAVRECEEECGIKQLHITKQLASTFHIYPYKKGFALKQSFWFYMQTNYSEKLIPQIEESIDEVRWFSEQEIKSLVLPDTYYTITDVIKAALVL